MREDFPKTRGESQRTKKKSLKRTRRFEERFEEADPVRYVRDKSGRFPQRPHYEPRELWDDECERIITRFMKESCGGFILPIPTEALTKLIERDTADPIRWKPSPCRTQNSLHG